MTKPAEQTEVVKIRLGTEDKVRLQEIAEKEFRSFADQCRLALSGWINQRGASCTKTIRAKKEPVCRKVD
jgi:hypothetical protein